MFQQGIDKILSPAGIKRTEIFHPFLQSITGEQGLLDFGELVLLFRKPALLGPQHLFFQFLHKFVTLSEEEFDEQIQPYTEVRHFRKKQLITKENEVENYLNFITKALVRKF